jgi:DNA polymerase-4
MDRTVLHIDMDAFFASVEQKRNPDLLGRPVIVGGVSSQRGVVSAASYEARRFGIRAGMPVWEARRCCPHGVFVPCDMDAYAQEGEHALHIYRRFTPCVEPLSIDEAFLDVTGSLRMFGGIESIGGRIKQAVRDELHLTASVGIAPNRLLAKMASDWDKPDGLAVVRPEDLPHILDGLLVSALWGVGPATSARLERMGVRSIADLRRIPALLLEREFGASGRRLYDGARGIDRDPVKPQDLAQAGPPGARDSKSMSHEVTLERDTSDRERLVLHLLALSDRVACRLRRHGCKARTVTLKLRFSNMHSITRQCRLAEPTDMEDVLFRESSRLLRHGDLDGRRIRLIGVAASNLVRGPVYRQMSLFEARSRSIMRLAQARDRVRDRYGDAAIVPASLVSFG